VVAEQRPRVVDRPLDVAALLQECEDAGSGALAVFVGRVRDHSGGRAVIGLSYEAHRLLAEKELRRLEADAVGKTGARVCLIQHRVGNLGVGDVSVVIAAAASHRDEAFAAARFAIDELKNRAPIWKREHYADGESAFVDGVPLRPPEGD
jgi:molybdopterin synthase catalytic subunit